MKLMASSLAVAMLLAAAQAGAYAQTFVFSKLGPEGEVLDQHTVLLQDPEEDIASYSDMTKIALPHCNDAQGHQVAVAVPEIPVHVGTMLSVRRMATPDRYLAAVFESKAQAGSCIPLVAGARTIASIHLGAGDTVKFASQLEQDGKQTSWWLERK